MKKVFLIISCVVYPFAFVCSQATNITTLFQTNYNKAEYYYHNLWYENAIELYGRVLEKDSSNVKSMVRIADCYRKLNNPQKTEDAYNLAFAHLKNIDDIDSINYYYYAQALSMNGRYNSAGKWYRQYGLLSSSDSRTQKKLNFISHKDFYLRDSSLFHIFEVPFNSEHSDFGVTYYDSGFVFISSRDNSLFIKYNSGSEASDEEPLLDLFYVKINKDGYYSEPRIFRHELNTRFNEGPLSFYSGGRKAILTRNSSENGKKLSSSDEKVKVMMFTAEMDEKNNWKKLVPFEYNNPDYSVGHPCLTKDNQRLYFSSDMPGGIGGDDIYVCYLEGSKWGKPVNLGPSVNTEGDELYPYLTDDSTLYFSSDGWGGFGGLDVFMAKGSGNTFNKTVNLGYPVNTRFDDFSFIMDDNGREGFFSSNRDGGKGSDDIYKFTGNYYTLAGRVLQLNTDLPIGEAEISVYDKNMNLITKKSTDNNGFFYTDVPFDEDLILEAQKTDYTLLEKYSYSTLGKKIGIDTIALRLWKHELFSKGIIYDNETQKPLSNAAVYLYDLNGELLDSAVTDNSGRYAFLLFPNNDYKLYIAKESYLSDSLEINTRQIMKGEIKNDFVLEKIFIHKLAVFYAFDKSDIVPGQDEPLEEVAQVLKKYPASYLLIGAHADSRGTFEYNMALSELRAKSAKDYLIARNIKPDRIFTRAFGESLIINRCVDGVHCNEIEHAKNRRADLKVMLTLPEDTSKLEF